MTSSENLVASAPFLVAFATNESQCRALYLVSLYKTDFHLVLCTVHIQDIIVCWRSVQSFTNNPLPIQIGREYFIELVRYKFQVGWFIQFKIQYQLRIKGPETKCVETVMGTGPLHVLANHCGTLVLHLSGVSRVFRVSSRC